MVDQVKGDRAILAAILCGSLSHDTVWEKSDIDLVFVTIDERTVAENGLSLYADGLNVHAMLVPRAEFRKAAEEELRRARAMDFGDLLLLTVQLYEQLRAANPNTAAMTTKVVART